MNYFRRLLTMVLLSFLLAPCCFGGSLPEVDTIGGATEGLLKDERFSDLDQLASGYIKAGTHVKGGNSALYHFYGALGSYAESALYGYSSSIPFTAKQRLLERWLAARPSSPAARIALAQLWSHYAWDIRGDAYADKVPASVWTLFHERLNNASGYLAGVTTKADPHLYYLLIENAKGQSASRALMDTLYDTAIHRFPNYFHYYSQRADILQVRWYGKPGELPRYVESVLVQPGGDAGLIAYSYIANALFQYYRRQSLLSETGLVWGSVKASYAARQKLYGLRNRDWNALCYLSLAAVDRVTAADALSHIGSDWDPVVWQEKKYFDAAVAWIRR